jgi:hypothetical protein
MSRTRSLFLLFVLIAALNLPLLAADKPQSFTGVITDAMCGVSHMAPNQTAAECTRACVKEGSKYALVVDKKVYTLEGHAAELDKLAGAKATVSGTLKGDTLQVTSIAAAK